MLKAEILWACLCMYGWTNVIGTDDGLHITTKAEVQFEKLET